jgi:hypothetical protein
VVSDGATDVLSQAPAFALSDLIVDVSLGAFPDGLGA